METQKNTKGVVVSLLVTLALCAAVFGIVVATNPPAPEPIPFDSGYDFLAAQVNWRDDYSRKQAEKAAEKEADKNVTEKEAAPAPETETKAPEEEKPAEAESSDLTVETSFCTLTLPDYWKDRVSIQYDDQGFAEVYAKGYSTYPLLSIFTVDTAHASGGDIGHYSVFAEEYKDGLSVTMWMYDYFYLVSGVGLTAEEAAIVIDLQTLGQTSGADVVADVESGMSEGDLQEKYSKVAKKAVDVIVPTIVLK